MDHYLLVALSSGFFGVLVTAIFQYLTARMNAKSKQDQFADVSQKYLNLADMTVDQLEERINLIGRLDNQLGEMIIRNRSLTGEIEELKAKRIERDGQIETLGAQLSALQEQINKDAQDRSELRLKLSEFEVKNRAMWQYLIALLEQMKKHDVMPVEPPRELQSDPEIMKIIQGMKSKGLK